MNEAHFRTLDLNLLRVLEAMLDEGSVTRAGARLGLTQSAVSHALGRLRQAVDDDLFVRGPEGMQPTPRAIEIGDGARRALLQLRSSLEPGRFDPRSTTERFTLGSTAYTSSVLLPQMFARVSAEAPTAALRVMHSPATVAEDLDSGRIDVALGAFGRVPQRFAFEPLFTERMVWALRAQHPAAHAPLTLEALAALPHLVLGTEEETAVNGSVVRHGLERRVIWDEGGVLEAELRREGLSRSIALTVPDAHTALAIAAGSDLAALTPERLARRLATAFRLRVFDPPYPSTAIQIGALWRRDLDSPARSWFRGLLCEAGKSV